MQISRRRNIMVYNKLCSVLVILMSISVLSFGGNPDRQGEAGAYELLLNPWARSAGLNAINTGAISGVEAMRLNIAGLVRVEKSEFMIGHADYLSTTNTKLNAIGLSQKMGKEKNGAIGISLMAIDFGDIRVTTTDQPEGTGGTFEPTFFNIGVGYSYMFNNRISVGILFRVVSESTSEVSAMGVGIDAGVQYVSGPKNNFKFGISLRNIGTKMNFQGQGLSIRVDPEGPTDELTVNQKEASFELPTMLNMGISYDFLFASDRHRITVLGNFTANSFSRDQLGAGIEYGFADRFMLRASYKAEVGSDENIQINNVYTGISAGASVAIPLSKKNNVNLMLDYAYRVTEVFDGTHNFGVSIAL
jgi:hypothetical protein